MNKKIPIHYVDTPQNKKLLDTWCYKQKVSMGELIRTAVHKYIEELRYPQGK